MAEPAFWDARLRRFGHTGWADAAIYAYDQRLRLRAVAALLPALPAARRALDFGCGVGDFSALLAGHFQAVTAHDISADILAAARRRVTAANVGWTTDRAAALAAGPYDLILSITVLQHVLDDADLQSLVHNFAAALTAAGRVVLLETTATPGAPAAHVKLRSTTALVALFAGAGLVLLQRHAFQHPVDNPTPGFVRYRRRPDVRLLRRLAGSGAGWARRRLDSIAARCAAHDGDGLSDGPGATQLMVFGHAAGQTGAAGG